jgi:hypothetical protein
MYKYPISEFDLPKFFKHLEDQFTWEDAGDGPNLMDRTHCTNLEDLRAQGSIVSTVDIYSRGFLLDEYIDFCGLEEGEEELEKQILETRGKEGCDKILEIAKERGWECDESMLSAAEGTGEFTFGVIVGTSGDDIIIETCFLSEDSVHGIYPPSFFPSGAAMPEIESMIKDLVESCVRKSKKQQSSRTS